MNISILFFAVAIGLKGFLYIDSARNWDYLFTLLYTYLGGHNYTPSTAVQKGLVRLLSLCGAAHSLALNTFSWRGTRI